MLEDSLGQVTIMGLVEREVTSSGELLQAYEGAISLRAVGSTAINQQSSRSHCTLQIQVQKRQRNAPAGAPVASSGRGRRSGLSFHEQKKVVPMGRIMLVDLAGLEDNRVTGNVGGALRESTAINTSHFALARMLWALKKNRNVPYRNSKLTRLFQNSMEPSIPLPAPPMVLMLVTVSPATKRFQATYNTFSAIQIDYKTISAEECEGIREEAVAAVARDREMIDVNDDDDVDAMSVTYEG
ncbi:kinesin heavy chain, putative [Perkinsus marinus ATCC 50983]|uniref:Kinesin heavy chain, putative n=1 Tax=Perkinsus marinus (strain ATCC 50983 / TXsc) TaxID=423536 RepID=C5LML4_PERM5|nr:kinesin heavy chain, putative [Perkinsus marinus ATCC 50983]EER02031.1 kinesin heavy chain, putative [Perkinsus marinus ATCC 50983]|eukprot:XP_002769313.1 kinesin heavy chain, putative [Perkinsus marinus ATCC 50983]